jgi:glycosyltransferase involved in cell wall biosynthesis
MKIALCSLAYNSERYIPETIGNMAGYVDEICVLVDSRTTDKSRDQLKDFKAKQKDYEWQHDFSDAKNKCVEMVSPDIDWIIWLDDDDKLKKSDCKKLTDRIRSLKDDNVGGIKLPQKNHYPDWSEDEDDYLVDFYPNTHHNVFRNIPTLKCFRRVHEDCFENSIKEAGFKVIEMMDINRHHHAWKGSREKFESDKHHYFESLRKLDDTWKKGDPLPEGAEDINRWDKFKGA